MKKIVEYIPVISALLLFVGFINYTTFYRFFDIEIIHYLTSGELILSFLPLAIPILLLILMISLMLIIHIIPLPGDSKRPGPSDERVSIWTIFLATETYETIKRQLKSKRTFRNVIRLLLLSLIFMLGITIIAFFAFTPFLLFPLAIDSQLFPEWDKGFITVLSALWFLLLFDMIMVAEKKGKIQHAGWINLFFLVIGFVFFITLSNKMKATDILCGQPHYSVKFEFQGKLVQTDSNIVYIGRTTDYLFLRNLGQKSNSAYQCGEIKYIEIVKLNQKKKARE